jgi:hypothetical protein
MMLDSTVIRLFSNATAGGFDCRENLYARRFAAIGASDALSRALCLIPNSAAAHQALSRKVPRKNPATTSGGAASAAIAHPYRSFRIA